MFGSCSRAAKVSNNAAASHVFMLGSHELGAVSWNRKVCKVAPWHRSGEAGFAFASADKQAMIGHQGAYLVAGRCGRRRRAPTVYILVIVRDIGVFGLETCNYYYYLFLLGSAILSAEWCRSLYIHFL